MKKSIKWFGLSIVLLTVLIVIAYFFWPKINDSQFRPICSSSCKSGAVCMSSSLGNSSLLMVRCVPIPHKAPIQNIKLPFNKHTHVYCTHSSGVGTHSWPNAYWALDLATSYDEKNATIYAALDGVAYVSKEHCQEPKGIAAKAEGSFCGQGFGNWVKIYHGDGYYTFYAHLDRILVKNGEHIRQGEPIGIEGWTGNAGTRHLHWSLQKLPGKTEQERIQQISTYIGDSVPFDFWVLDPHDGFSKLSTIELDCNTTSTNQPNFMGTL